MTPDSLELILTALPDLQIGVIGDFCRDCYWDLKTEPDVLSVETGKEVR
jgi:hypothetical protein